MRLGYITSPERGETDLRLARLATALLAQGVAVAGAVQVNSDCPGDAGCDMDLQVIPEGPMIRISQRLGSGSKGCRLDPGALETAVAEVAGRMAGAKVLILNKFGKHEGEGRGFRHLIGQALSDGVPVLVGVNAKNMAAFEAFAGGLAEPLDGPDEVLMAWVAEGVPA
jgi:Protein of unknown function (DUF2478)